MSAVVTVKGADGIHRALAKWLNPELNKELDAATKKAAQLYARDLRTALRPVSRRMARAVRVHRARRDKPAWVVGSRRKTAFFWPFVIGGTRDHGPRTARLLAWESGGQSFHARRVRGVRPNPIVERVASRSEAKAQAEVDTYLGKNT